MTLDELLLEKLAKWRPDSERQTLDVAHPESGWTVVLTADRVDVVGCQLWEVTLKPATAPPTTDLKARAEQLAARVTGLLEPLRFVELDAARQVAMLRSNSPSQRGEGLFYYEVLLQADGTLGLRRYQASRTGETRRQQIAFALTHEALAKIVADLTAPL
jgi:hypothetical protein